jgi:ATP-dependent RNA helicase RhlE
LLIDIEKMIKHKFVPAQLAGFVPVTNRGTGERRRREDVDTRSSGRPAPAARSAYASGPRKEKVDPWFLKPYEPSVAATSDPTENLGKSSSIKPHKGKVAALLGGLSKRT